MSDLFEQFLKYNPNFTEELHILPSELKSRLLKKLNSANKESNFLSTVSEIRFGLLFTQLGFSIQYDSKIGEGKTPDWEISIDNKKAICEVYRLGQSEFDQKISDFENRLKRGFEEIRLGYKIRYCINDDSIETEGLQIEDIISKLEEWLNNNVEIDDILQYNNMLEFKILAFDQKNKLTYIPGPKSIDYQTDRLVQNENHNRPNRVFEKLIKYTEEISAMRVPYFVCIENDFRNGFNFGEFYEYFQAAYCIREESFNGVDYEIETTSLGCLYDHINVSGIIIKMGNEYRKILNPLKTQLIYSKENLPILNRINLIKDIVPKGV